MKQHTFRLLAVLTTASFLFSTTFEARAEGHSVADRVVATVGETEITLGHLIAMAQNLPEQQRAMPADRLFLSVLERLIQQEAIAQSLTQIPKLTMLQMENERRSLLASTAVEAMAAEINVSPEAVQAAYDAQYSEFSPEKEFKAAHILVETEEEAVAIIAELDGGASFDDLARERSTGPSGPNGGNLGWFGPGRMVKPFEDAVRELTVGQVSPPVQTQFGWHVILLSETRIPSIPTLDDIRGELEQKVWQEEFNARAMALIDAVPIERKDLEGLDAMMINKPELITE